ncbi:MAG: M15 family metallopeptidase [Ideonella sp.]|nr:M15 family metallopeptidase [Ideonella sp.]
MLIETLAQAQPGRARSLRCELVAGQADFRRLGSIEGLRVDLRYAAANNFVGRNLYSGLDCAWLHREAAQGLEAAVAWLRQHHPGHTLLVLDALRPHRVQEALWQELAGTDLRQYLADPARGSIHSFGMAVDVALLDPQGAELDMGSGFDDFTLLSHPRLEQEHLAQGRLDQIHIANRLVLRQAMLDSGFTGIMSEWWHFQFGDMATVREHYLRIE